LQDPHYFSPFKEDIEGTQQRSSENPCNYVCKDPHQIFEDSVNCVKFFKGVVRSCEGTSYDPQIKAKTLTEYFQDLRNP